jgi:K(+)-stimulated pyrophosphate-energized sodium pump
MDNPALIALIVAILGLLFVGYTAQQVLRRDQGNEAMVTIGRAIQEGATAFLFSEYRVLIVFVAIVAIVMAVAPGLGIGTAVSFIVGAFTSGLAGFIGMNIAVRSNLRTAAAAQNSLNDGLRVAFGSGSVMGMSVVGLALLGLSVLFLAFGGNADAISAITGFGFGASSIALFARVGGGIYTKAADVGADLVGKVEAGIPEDDPRNPAVIADNVGDNVGDVAGMGADLFESYSWPLRRRRQHRIRAIPALRLAGNFLRRCPSWWRRWASSRPLWAPSSSAPRRAPRRKTCSARCATPFTARRAWCSLVSRRSWR